MRKVHLAIVLTILFQAFLSYVILDPKVGYDDANITQGYAQNIANGYGYVYNPGGERVEGSTSPLWTALNALAFLLPGSIMLVTLMSFIVAYLILLVSANITKALTGSESAAVVTVGLFNLLPYVLGWWLYSLLDIGLFVLVTAASIYFFRLRSERYLWLGFFCLAILPTVRPEGIAVALGVVSLSILIPSSGGIQKKNIAIGLILPVLSFALLTLFRLEYFGFPFPNTFYAKTSPEIVGQTLQGLRYIVRFLTDPMVLLMLAAIVVGLLVPLRSNEEQIQKVRMHLVFSTIFIGAGLTVYMVLGGDHFAGFRFLHFAFPIAISALVAKFYFYFKEQPLHLKMNGWESSVMAACLAVVVCLPFYNYLTMNSSNRGMALELRIAEYGRDLGQKLDTAIGQDLSIAIIAAGGIRMGYKGFIYDVLGLNWVEMAHSDRPVDPNLTKNHGGFDPDIFWRNTPDVAFPLVIDCQYDYVIPFQKKLLKGVLESEEFKDEYAVYCHKDLGLVFYGKRKHEERFISSGMVLAPKVES